MQKKDITLTFEDEKLDALEFSLKKKGSSVQRRMQEALKNLYDCMQKEGKLSERFNRNFE